MPPKIFMEDKHSRYIQSFMRNTYISSALQTVAILKTKILSSQRKVLSDHIFFLFKVNTNDLAKKKIKTKNAIEQFLPFTTS